MTNELKIVDEIKIMERTYQIIEENVKFVSFSAFTDD